MVAYLMIHGMRIQHVNAMTSWNVVGAPAIMAHLGFAGAIARRFDVEVDGVAILHHGLDHEGVYQYGRLEPNRVRGVPYPSHPGDKKLVLSDQPFALAHYEASLLVRVEGDDLDALSEHAGDGRLAGWLLGQARFAGGTIVRIKMVSLVHDLTTAMDRLPRRGFWVLDANEKIAVRAEGQDQLDAAIAQLYPLGPSKPQDVKKSWLALSLVGYLMLETPQQRQGVRQDLSHAFCEPLLGMVEYRSRRHTQEETPLFWRMEQVASDAIVARVS